MGIEIIGKLTQKNNGDFKLVDLENVDYDGTGKSAKQELEKKIEDVKNSLDAPTIKSDIQDLKDNKINLIEDETSMEGISDTEHDTLETKDKRIIGAINEVNSQCKDKANKINEIKWINVVEAGLDSNGVIPIDDGLQKIIDENPDFSVFYFPCGSYRMTKGVVTNKSISIIGDSGFLMDIPRVRSGITEIRTEGVDNIILFRFTDGIHSIKNMNFYSDSFSTTESASEPTSSKPQLHWINTINYNNVSAIIDETNKPGSNYENLYFSGFSNISLKMGYFSTLDKVSVFTSSLGVKSGKDSFVSNLKCWGCENSAYVQAGTSLNNARLEECSKIGLTVESDTKCNNVTIDQCGYTGLLLTDGAIEVSFNGKITRCSQFYFNTDFDTYNSLSDKVEEAFSLIYVPGNARDCNFILTGSNKGNYKDGASNTHTIPILKGNFSETKIIINNDGNNLVHKGNGDIILINQDIFKYRNGVLLSKNGIDLTTFGNEIVRYGNGRIFINDGNNNFNKSFIAEVGLVLGSTSSNNINFGYAYGGKWACIGQLTIDAEVVYFHKKISM